MEAHPGAGVRRMWHAGDIGRPCIAAIAETSGRLRSFALHKHLVRAHVVYQETL